MTQCKHPKVELRLQIEQWIDGTANGDDGEIVRNMPAKIRVTVACHQCSYANTFNAHSPETNYWGSAVERWPKWLIERLKNFARHSEQVQETLQACGIK